MYRFNNPEAAPAETAAPAAAPAEAQQPAQALAVGEVQSSEPKAFEGTIFEYLPREIAADPALAKTEGKLDVLARSYLAAQRMIGASPDQLVKLPADLAGDEGAAAFREIAQKFGLPETIETYELAAREGTHPNLAVDKPMGKAFREVAHGAGLLPKQAQQVYDWFAETAGKTLAEQEAEADRAYEQDVAALKSELGESFDARVQAANFALDKLGGKELADRLEKAGLGAYPPLVKMLAEIGIRLDEPREGTGGALSTGGHGRFGDTMTPEQARARGSELLEQANAIAGKNPAKAREIAAEAHKWFARARGEKAA